MPAACVADGTQSPGVNLTSRFCDLLVGRERADLRQLIELAAVEVRADRVSLVADHQPGDCDTLVCCASFGHSQLRRWCRCTATLSPIPLPRDLRSAALSGTMWVPSPIGSSVA